MLCELKDGQYKLDIAKAKAPLAEAGHADDIAVKINHRNDPQTMAVAQAIQGTLTQAGIKVELTAMTGKQSLGEYRAREHDLYLGAWGPDYPDPHNTADTFAHKPHNPHEAKLTAQLTWPTAWDMLRKNQPDAGRCPESP